MRKDIDAVPVSIPIISITGTVGDSKRKSYLFALSSGFSDSYTNRLDKTMGDWRTHWESILWKGGELDDLAIQINLAVGIYIPGCTRISSPTELREVVEGLYSMSLGKSGTGETSTPPESVVLSVGGLRGGSWFIRRGIIRNFKAAFAEEKAWDSYSGQPMTAKVDITVAADFADVVGGGRNKARMEQLPRRPWRYWKTTYAPGGLSL